MVVALEWGRKVGKAAGLEGLAGRINTWSVQGEPPRGGLDKDESAGRLRGGGLTLSVQETV